MVCCVAHLLLLVMNEQLMEIVIRHAAFKHHEIITYFIFYDRLYPSNLRA